MNGLEDADGVGFAFNGLNGASGEYAFGLAGLDDVLALALASARDPADRTVVSIKAGEARPDFGVRFGVDANDLSSAGWGVVVGRGVPSEHVAALQPLLTVREAQAGARYRVFAEDDAPAADENGLQWLARHRMGPGPANPDKVPYYLLAVGAPEHLGLDWQHDLDTQYAVGRLDLISPEEFAAYAATVVAAEQDPAPVADGVALFAPRNTGDRATALSNRQLVRPLTAELANAAAGLAVTEYRADHARKEELGELIASGPCILLTASHGIEFDAGHPRQLGEQGAVVCQDWPGPLRWAGEIPSDFIYAAADVPAQVSPRLVFLFACYGGGTPSHDRFGSGASPPLRLAGSPFSARLPSRLLAAPDGGALAVIAHVDRVWSCSFSWPGAGAQVDTFTDAIRAMLAGYRIGHALEPFDQRYAQLADSLAQILIAARRHGERPDPAELVRIWTAAQDARSFTLLGDPAVCVHPSGGRG